LLLPTKLTIGERMQPGCMTKILEAERWLKSTDLHEAALLQRQQEQGDAGRPIWGLERWKGATHEGRTKAWPLPGGNRSPFIGRSPHLHPLASQAKSPPTCSRVLPLRHGGWAPHVVRADPKREGGEPPHAKHVTALRLQAFPHPRRNRRTKGRAAKQGACNRTTVMHPFGFVTSGGPARRPGPTYHATGATVTRCEETTSPPAPMPRLLDYRTSAATRGSPACDPIVPIGCSGHGSVSCRARHDS
jgi:hypothetical protein